MDWWLSGILILLFLFIFLAGGIPVAFSLGIVSVAALILTGGFSAASAIRYIPFSVLTNFILTPIPIFVLMAELLTMSGISRDLFDTLYKWFGRIPGGVAFATILTGVGIGAMSGVSAAACAILAVFCIDEFERFKYRRSLASGCITATGALAILIPPSIPMVVYASLTNQSLSKLFLAGIIPGLSLAAFYCIYVIWDGIKNQHLYAKPERVSFKRKMSHLPRIGPSILIIVLVLGTIYAGLATATESAALGCVAIFVISLIRRKVNLSAFMDALLRSVSVNCMIFFILFCAMLLGHAMTFLTIPQSLTKTIISTSLSGWTVILSSQLLLLFLGFFLDILSIIIITIPILVPIIVAYGYDPIWFGIMIVVNMEMAVLTPPVALNLWVFYGVARKYGYRLKEDIIPGIIPFLVMDGIFIALLFAFPQLVLWLPSLIK